MTLVSCVLFTLVSCFLIFSLFIFLSFFFCFQNVCKLWLKFFTSHIECFQPLHGIPNHMQFKYLSNAEKPISCRGKSISYCKPKAMTIFYQSDQITTTFHSYNANCQIHNPTYCNILYLMQLQNQYHENKAQCASSITLYMLNVISKNKAKCRVLP